MKVLIISGPTREKIDDIRFISNISTGSTGSFLARFLSKNHQVTQLFGKGSLCFDGSDDLAEFESTHNLKDLAYKYLSSNSFDAVIMCAAVSDYSIAGIEVNDIKYKVGEIPKISSDASLSISLTRNEKIIQGFKEFSKNKNIKVIGFKLTSNAESDEAKEAVNKLFKSEVDFVVHNDLSNISKEKHAGNIFSQNKSLAYFESKESMARNLEKILEVQE